MPIGWRLPLGKITALLGVLGLLLFGATPVAARLMVGHVDQHTASAPAVQYEGRHDHFIAAEQTSVKATSGGEEGAWPLNCVYQHGRTCCVIEACSALSMAPGINPRDAFAWLGTSIAFMAYGATVPGGVGALPATPPPRREA